MSYSADSATNSATSARVVPSRSGQSIVATSGGTASISSNRVPSRSVTGLGATMLRPYRTPNARNASHLAGSVTYSAISSPGSAPSWWATIAVGNATAASGWPGSSVSNARAARSSPGSAGSNGSRPS